LIHDAVGDALGDTRLESERKLSQSNACLHPCATETSEHIASSSAPVAPGPGRVLVVYIHALSSIPRNSAPRRADVV